MFVAPFSRRLESPMPEPSEPSAPAAAPSEPSARKAWRTVAFARRCTKVYNPRGGLQTVLGGEILDDPVLVATLKGDAAFEFHDVTFRDELDELRTRYEQAVEALRKDAATLGLVVYRDGEVEPPRRRG
jgi:hypothetical protein